MIRTRIAPSPTGSPHVGTAYTALLNYAFARKEGGKFIVRIEDTDRRRYVKGAEKEISDSLRWLGLDYDEGPDVGGDYGPYRQSERLELYRKYAQQLIERGRAYYCFCTSERLEEMRKRQQKESKPPKYDRTCLTIPKGEAKERAESGESYVIRLKIPDARIVEFDDIIRGKISVDSSAIDDQILLKSDGYPTYHLAVVVDDYLMKVSHIIRGEEWLSSVPKHVLLYQAFGWELPKFAHTPLLRGPNREKLGKRFGHASLEWFRKEGYLPEALLNFLALLGWSHPEGKEIFSFEEFVEKFSLERVSPVGPVFDLKKLDWMNGKYIRALSVDQLAKKIRSHSSGRTEERSQGTFRDRFDSDPGTKELGSREPASAEAPASAKATADRSAGRLASEELLKKVIPLVQERMKKLSEFDGLTDFFFKDEIEVDINLLVQKKKAVAETKKILSLASEFLSSVDPWEHAKLEKVCRDLVGKSGWSVKDLFMTLRVAITGKSITPPLFETMEVLGKDKVLKRLKSVRGIL